MAHSEPTNLLGLVGSLWNREDAFSIWIDAKADEEVVQAANVLAGLAGNVKTCLGRVGSWGGFSVVDTTLIAYGGLRDQFGDFSHVVLCSGTHIPLLHPDRIWERIRDIPGWMSLCQVAIPEGGLRACDSLPPGWLRDILTRVRYRYAEVPGIGMLPIEKRDTWIEPSVPTGSQWHILRRDIIDFIVEHRSDIRDNFRDVLMPEEHAFQWIALRYSGLGGLLRGDHVFMQWNGASPRRLSFLEVRNLAAVERFLFARKAQTGSTVEDWAAWARDGLGNVDGARYLQEASAPMGPPSVDALASERSKQGGKACDRLIGVLEAELSASLNTRAKVVKLSRWRHLIDSGKRHKLGGPIYFLCFAEPVLGISVVPALRYADLDRKNPMRDRLRPRFSREFVAFPIGGRLAWSIGSTDTLSDCKEFVNSVFKELQ